MRKLSAQVSFYVLVSRLAGEGFSGKATNCGIRRAMSEETGLFSLLDLPNLGG